MADLSNNCTLISFITQRSYKCIEDKVNKFFKFSSAVQNHKLLQFFVFHETRCETALKRILNNSSLLDWSEFIFPRSAVRMNLDYYVFSCLCG